MSDLVHALAFAYRRKGADRMGASELPLLYAFGLHWFAPADAKRLVERALAGGFLVRDGEDLVLAFDKDAVDIPLNFRPTAAVLEEPFPPMPPRRAHTVAAEAVAPAPAPETAPDDTEAHAEIARRGGLMTLDAARLVVARRHGEDVAAGIEAAERKLLGTRP